jgi:hypothetical protein
MLSAILTLEMTHRSICLPDLPDRSQAERYSGQWLEVVADCSRDFFTSSLNFPQRTKFAISVAQRGAPLRFFPGVVCRFLDFVYLHIFGVSD